MSRRNTMVPEAKAAMEQFKMEAANDLTSKQAGSVGGQMVKKMIESYEKSMK